jgi:hypothetical protein
MAEDQKAVLRYDGLIEVEACNKALDEGTKGQWSDCIAALFLASGL